MTNRHQKIKVSVFRFFFKKIFFRMTNLTLKYFVVKARGEVARLILKGSAGKWHFVRFDLTWKRTLEVGNNTENSES